jgi:hypothetical protein
VKQFPKVVYVVSENEDDEQYFTTFDDSGEAIEHVGDGGKVAAYTLDRVMTAEIVRKFKGGK